jgi:hypothetical protein
VNRENIIGWIPAATIIWLAASGIYVTGYFTYIGRQWITALSAPELLSISLSALPPMAISMVAGWLFSEISKGKNRGILTRFAHRQELKWDFIPKIGMLILLVFCILVVTAGHSYIPPEKAMVIFFSGAYAFFVSLAYIVMYRSPDDASRSVFATYLICPILFIFAYGETMGAYDRTRNSADLIYFANGNTSCVNVIFISSRGVILNKQPGNSVDWIKDDKYKAISKDARCK